MSSFKFLSNSKSLVVIDRNGDPLRLLGAGQDLGLLNKGERDSGKLQ